MLPGSNPWTWIVITGHRTTEKATYIVLETQRKVLKNGRVAGIGRERRGEAGRGGVGQGKVEQSRIEQSRAN